MDKQKKKNEKILQKMEEEKNKLPFKERVKKGFETAKDFFIKDTSKMILLVAILIAVYLVINLWVSSINLAQIDLTEGKTHTLTDQSKNIVKKIDKEMKFYVWGYSENSNLVDLLKQYNAVNSKITYEIVKNDNKELIDKYGFEDSMPSVIGVNSDQKHSYIYDGDLYSYDNNFQVVDLTEQKITNAIVNLSTTETTNIYFVEGRTNYQIGDGTSFEGATQLANWLSLDYYNVQSLNIVATPTIPDDCNVLVIMGIANDFTEAEAKAICDYIEKGGDILITNDINYNNTIFPNFQKILDEYGVSLPNKVLVEGKSNTIAGADLAYFANAAADHEITRLMYNYDFSTKGETSIKPILISSGIIEIDTKKQIEQQVSSAPFLTSSSEASVSDIATKKVEKPSNGTYFVTGASFKKTVESGDESRAVILASTGSFSDNVFNEQYQLTFTDKNLNYILNSFAFVANKGELYSIRKSSSDTIPFNATEKQDKIVKTVLVAIPTSIAVLGVCVWINRRKLK